MTDFSRYWTLTPKEAVVLQNELRGQVVLQDRFDTITTVAGVDVAIGRGWKEARCGIVVLSFAGLEIIERVQHVAPVTFPYVPGLLAFRELPIFFATRRLLNTAPDLYFFDGQGYAHPRRFGLACLAGVLLDQPVIGCAKSKLIGEFEMPDLEAGSHSPLFAPEGDRIGDVLRTKTSVKPVFISPGHRVSFETATSLSLACTRGHRIPEPTRLAHFTAGSGC